MSGQSVATVRATAVRKARAQRLGLVSTASRLVGRERAADLLRDPPPELRTLAARKLLLRVKGVGEQRADRLLLRVGASADRAVGELTVRQRDLLADLLLNTR